MAVPLFIIVWFEPFGYLLFFHVFYFYFSSSSVVFLNTSNRLFCNFEMSNYCTINLEAKIRFMYLHGFAYPCKFCMFAIHEFLVLKIGSRGRIMRGLAKNISPNFSTYLGIFRI